MSRTSIVKASAWVLAWLFAATQACSAADAPAGTAFLPVVKTARDLPLRAEVAADNAVLMAIPGGDTAAALDPIPAGTKVFVLQKNDSHAQVLTARGNSGWLALTALSDGQAADDQDFQPIARAINNPAAQAALDPRQTQLLQATFVAALASKPWGLLESSGDKAPAMQQELAALAWVRERNIQGAWPILLGHWEDRFINEINYDYDGAESLAYETVDWRVLFPGLLEALGTNSDIDRPLCRRFKKDESSGSVQYAFGRYGTFSNFLFLSLIKSMQQSRPLADCVVAALKKIAATNRVDRRGGYRPGDVEFADELLGATQPKNQLEKWVADLAKQATPASGANLAVALFLLKGVDAQPHVARLMALASSKADNASDEVFAAQHMAIWALATRAPSRRVDDLLRTILLQAQADAVLRIDALRILAQRPLEPGLREVLEKIVKSPTGAEPSRLRQLAVETLATEPLRQSSLPVLQTVMGDADVYIGNAALQAVRNEALRGMKAARSADERSRIRGKYLESLRKQVEGLSTKTDDPLFKKNPLWMLKPQARLSIQSGGDEPLLKSQALPSARIATAPWFDPPSRPIALQIAYAESQPRMPEAYAIHPGKVLFKYGVVGRKKTVTVALQLDDLAIDGQDLVSRVFPAIYTVTLQSSDGRTSSYAWYCEPDEAFWSEAGFDTDSGG